jgi:hypothetical protein
MRLHGSAMPTRRTSSRRSAARPLLSEKLLIWPITAIRLQSVELLNRNLASAIDLERQAKQADWNVKGPNFIALHVLPWKERSRK